MSKDKPTHTRQPVRSTFLVNESRSQSLPSSAVASMPAESDVLGDGISGSAMAVPPPKAATSAIRPDNTVKTTKGSPRKSMLLSKLDTSNGNTKITKQVIDRSQELEDALAREKQLQEQVSSLQQLVNSLRVDLNTAKTCNEELLTRQLEMEEQHKTALEKETLARIKVEEDFEEKCQQLHIAVENKNLTEQQLAELRLLTKQLEGEVSDLMTQKDAELADRDAKLARLKTQLADSLTGNSRERQQQLEELRQNLEKVQEEADILRSQLRNVQKSSQDNCRNCREMKAKMAHMQSASEASERTIKNLKEVIALHDHQPADGTVQQRSTVNLQKS